jgi:hypothetical protein
MSRSSYITPLDPAIGKKMQARGSEPRPAKKIANPMTTDRSDATRMAGPARRSALYST